jgi:hypothetical protein
MLLVITATTNFGLLHTALFFLLPVLLWPTYGSSTMKATGNVCTNNFKIMHYNIISHQSQSEAVYILHLCNMQFIDFFHSMLSLIRQQFLSYEADYISIFLEPWPQPVYWLQMQQIMSQITTLKFDLKYKKISENEKHYARITK